MSRHYTLHVPANRTQRRGFWADSDKAALDIAMAIVKATIVQRDGVGVQWRLTEDVSGRRIDKQVPRG